MVVRSRLRVIWPRVMAGGAAPRPVFASSDKRSPYANAAFAPRLEWRRPAGASSVIGGIPRRSVRANAEY